MAVSGLFLKQTFSQPSCLEVQLLACVRGSLVPPNPRPLRSCMAGMSWLLDFLTADRVWFSRVF